MSENDGERGANDPDDPAAAYREPDPEADLPDPESELPEVPSVDVPSAPTPQNDASPELLKGFWSTVLVFNVALLSTSVGAMMLVFGVERPLGVGLLAVGLVSLLRGYRKYRTLDERHRRGELTGRTDESPPDDERND